MGSSAILPVSPAAERLRTVADTKRLCLERLAKLKAEQAERCPGHVGGIPGDATTGPVPREKVDAPPKRHRDEPDLDTQKGIVLAAARDLTKPWTVERMTRLVFALRPALFALKGSPQWPDVRKVATSLFGPYGLVANGWVEKVGRGKYQAVREDAPQRTRLHPRLIREEG